MNCPCKKCLCLAICRHKFIHTLFRECSLLQKYNPNYEDVEQRNIKSLFHLQNIMKPTGWEFGYSPNDPYQKYPVFYIRREKPYLVER